MYLMITLESDKVHQHPAPACEAELSQETQEFVGGQTDVGRDLAQQRGRDVATRVEGNSGAATVGVPELLVRAALPDLAETVGLK